MTDGAPSDEPVAIGGRLDPATVIAGYRHGVFAMPAGSAAEAEANHFLYEPAVAARRTVLLDPPSPDPYALTWWSPDPRPVIRHGEMAKPRSLMRQLRNRVAWTTSADRAFERVLAGCRADRTPQWLTDDLCRCMTELHRQGWAHSAEVWDGEELIGGAIGVGVGAVFSLDTCFHRRDNASKVALLDLEYRLAGSDVLLLDVEWDSERSRRQGAGPLRRGEFLAVLARGAEPVPLDGGVQEARRLGFLRA
jgi:leucyl/phenylalanyl-tRNA--protein transferase